MSYLDFDPKLYSFFPDFCTCEKQKIVKSSDAIYFQRFFDALKNVVNQSLAYLNDPKKWIQVIRLTHFFVAS